MYTSIHRRRARHASSPWQYIICYDVVERQLLLYKCVHAPPSVFLQNVWRSAVHYHNNFQSARVCPRRARVRVVVYRGIVIYYKRRSSEECVWVCVCDCGAKRAEGVRESPADRVFPPVRPTYIVPIKPMTVASKTLMVWETLGKQSFNGTCPRSCLPILIVVFFFIYFFFCFQFYIVIVVWNCMFFDFSHFKITSNGRLG